MRARDPADDGVVRDERPGDDAAGDEQHVRVWQLVERRVRAHLEEAGFVRHRSGLRGDERDLGAGERGEHLERPEGIEGGEPFVEPDGDAHVALVVRAAAWRKPLEARWRDLWRRCPAPRNGRRAVLAPCRER
jgi:hypothetical protein